MRWHALVIAWALYPALCPAVTFTVSTTADSGADSLRQAILDANANPGADTITFNIAGGGVNTITLFTALPQITEAVTIDGTTQPGYGGLPLIDLNGNLRPGLNGLVITAGNCTVRGLAIRNCGSSSNPGSGIVLTNAGSNVIQACLIGTGAGGTNRQRNSLDGILINNSPNNVIGGTDPANRNLISGNSRNGVLINGAGSSNNVVLGNYIGTGIAGTNALSNNSGFTGGGGVAITNAPNNTIGGAAAGAGNVISGNSGDQVLLSGLGATGNQLEGNRIGIRADGAAFSTTPSSDNGVRLDNAPGNTIGGTAAGAGNVISGNNFAVIIGGANSTGTVVQGNFIGTDISGTARIANHEGVYIQLGGGSLIGGTAPGTKNVISGNQVDGVSLSPSSGNTVQGNFIGTDVTGMLRLGNGAPGFGSGINVFGSSNLIGGTVAGARNVISGNGNDGLDLYNTTTTSNAVQGNYIGVAADGNSSLSNGYRGISVLGACSNIIGGASSGAANVIANNGLEGILLGGTSGFFGPIGTNNLVQGNVIVSNHAAGVTLLGANRISRNSIYNNGGLGIDISGDGPTPNTPGNRHNYPVITATRRGSTDTTCTLDAAPNDACTIEVFSSHSCESGPCQGQTYLCSMDIATDSSGHCDFTVHCSIETLDGDYITCTSTSSSDGHTSEICVPVLFPSGGALANPALSAANFVFGGSANHPISTFTGELFDLLPPDLNVAGPMPLFFRRYYASMIKRDGLIAGKLGDNWLHNFEMTLALSPSNTVNVVNNQGRLIQFTNSAGSFILIGRQDIPFQLITNAGNYVLGDPRSQLLYSFNGSGRLITVADGHGNSHTLNYTGGQLTSVTDGLGGTLSFLYSPSGFLTNVSDGARSVSFAQTGNNLTGSRDALGFLTAYNYDLTNANSGLVTALVRPEGNIPYSQTFNTNGQVATQTEAGTNTTSLVYSNTTTILTDPLGNVRRDVHSTSGALASFTDEANQTISLGSDASGRRASVSDRLGQTTTIAYHAPSGYPAAITNADGTSILFGYTNRVANGITFYELSQVTYPDSTTENFTYDASGNVRTRTDQAGKVWSFGYNARGQLLAATNPAGGVATFTYNADGTLASSTDLDLGLTTYAYDTLRRLTNILHPDTTAISALFDANDRLVSITDERVNTTFFDYDQNNRLTQVVDANGRTNRFAYDSRDRLAHATDRLGRSSSTSYDTLDNVATVTDRNGNVTSFGHDARRRPTSVTDAGGKTWTSGYDNEAILTAFANPLAQTNTVRTDQLGYPTNFTDALAHSLNLTLNNMRRVTRLLDPIGRTNTFAYDSRGPLSLAGRQGIGAATYQRNDLGLLSQISDLNSNKWQFAYTGMGRAQSATDALNRTNTFSYDTRGRLQKTAFADGTTRSNTYDPAGNLTRVLHSGGPDLQYNYDALNRLVAANELALAYDAEGRVTNTASSGVNFGAVYDADGRLTNITYNGGAFGVAYSYDNRDRLTRVRDSLAGAQIDFAYDDAGRLTGMTRANGVNGTYTYDAAGRLTRIQEGSIIDIQYALNDAGEVTAANFTVPLDPGGFTNPMIGNFSYDAAHQLLSAGYAFDSRGRQTSSPRHTLAWDGASRLVGIDGVTLSYNGLEDIVTRAQGGTTMRYFYNYGLRLAPIVAEKNDTAGQFVRYYVWSPGGRLLYMIDAANGNAVYYFHFDRVGSTLALSSAAGAVADAYAYSPYGSLLGHTGTSQQPFTYIGRFGVRSETAANLHQMKARYFDPISARFLTPDPIWPRLDRPQDLNPYQYAARNPIRYIDPWGTQDEEPAGGESSPGDAGTPPDAGDDAGGESGMMMAVYTKGTWPTEMTKRPITLARGTLEIGGGIVTKIGPDAYVSWKIVPSFRIAAAIVTKIDPDAYVAQYPPVHSGPSRLLEQACSSEGSFHMLGAWFESAMQAAVDPEGSRGGSWLLFSSLAGAAQLEPILPARGAARTSGRSTFITGALGQTFGSIPASNVVGPPSYDWVIKVEDDAGNQAMATVTYTPSP